MEKTGTRVAWPPGQTPHGPCTIRCRPKTRKLRRLFVSAMNDRETSPHTLGQVALSSPVLATFVNRRGSVAP